MKKKRLQVYVSPELYRQAQEAATAARRKVTDFVILAIEDAARSRITHPAPHILAVKRRAHSGS